MNFLGHAAVACWFRTTPAFVLGAMLPDFGAIARAPFDGSDDVDVAAGVELHHRTDAVFHATPGFDALCRWSVERLVAGGTRRGVARALAHVGVELLIDGRWQDDSQVRGAYVAALDAAGPARLGPSLRFRGEGGADRFEALRRRLASYGAPAGYADTAFVAARLGDALRKRPMLAPTADEEGLLVPWLDHLLPRVHAAAPDIVRALEVDLSHEHW